MNLLLDTHTFIWFASGDQKLSNKAKKLLLDGDNVLYLSMASLWEMSIKASLGKLTLGEPIEQLVQMQMQVNGLKLLNIKASHTFSVASLPWHHRDPFDRLLVCQSKCENMPMISCDKLIGGYQVEQLW